MDEPHYSPLLAALEAVPDPRQARGQRHAWRHLLLILAAGLARQQQSARAIAQWSQLHARALRRATPHVRRIPSESTMLRTLRRIDVATLEQHLALFVTTLPPPLPKANHRRPKVGTRFCGQAIDGTWVRTATAHGRRTLLVSLVQHTSGCPRAHAALAPAHTERAACQQVLQQRDLTGTVSTMDGGLRHRGLAQQIRQQGGHDLLVTKQNHPQMRDEVMLFFTVPRLPADAHERYDYTTSVTKGHGRLDVRTLECMTGWCMDWRWPEVAQVVRRTCERVVGKTGERTVTVSHGITSLTADEARAADLEALWRRHWTIENRKHYVRDVTLGEDRTQIHTGNAPQVRAALRNALLDVWRAQGWGNIADATRACGASVHRALTCIGALSAPQ